METTDWKVDLHFDGSANADGGAEVLVELLHCPTNLMLGGRVHHYEDEPAVLVQVHCTDLAIPVSAAARLLGKLFRRYYTDLYAAGGGSITAWPDLLDLLEGTLYANAEDSDKVDALLRRAIGRPPATPSQALPTARPDGGR